MRIRIVVMYTCAIAGQRVAMFDPGDKRLYTRAVRYEWDPEKAAANLRTHGVDFADAVSVLEDDLALTREDMDSMNEQRFVTLGMNAFGLLLIVVHTYREQDIIRIIPAWKANRRQRRQYAAKRS